MNWFRYLERIKEAMQQLLFGRRFYTERKKTDPIKDGNTNSE
jgi:hypothetical protein